MASGDDTDPRQWREALALFERLAALDAAAAEEALQQAEPAVAERVRRMRRAEASRGPLDQRLPGIAPPERLGRWRLGEVLGRGGMSVVYRARSATPPEDQQAALKLLALPAPGDEAATRFQREAGILARLRHPGIAPLHDAGVAPDGRPWFAMGLVEGETMDAWRRRTGAGPRECVARVAEVADAVAHAHQHLVVHRDIKPGNVMVDAAGRVVLLDFGISRVLEEGAAELTQGGSYPLTPRYAAPEQRSGGAVSTATDVWGLGALLHSLLLGEPPELPEGADTVSLPRGAALPADLAAVLRQALAREPGQRYATAAGFANDLRAWQAGRPVAARRGGAGYRFRRWLVRNPALAGLSLALVASVLVGITVSLGQAREARDQAETARSAQAQAEAARERAEVVRDYVAQLFASADPSRGKEPTAGDLLAAGEARVDARLEQTQPDVAVELLRLMGVARGSRGEYAAAESLFERGLAIGARDASIDPSLRWRLMEFYGAILHTQGKGKRAIELLSSAQALAKQHGADEEDILYLAVGLARAESAVGQNEAALARLEPLRERFRAPPLAGSALHLKFLEVLSTTRALLKLPDDRELFQGRLEVAAEVYADNPGWLAFTYADAVPTLRRWNEYVRAQDLADRAVAIADEHYAQPHVIAAIAYCNAGGLALERGNLVPARELLDRTLAIDEALGRIHHHALSCRHHRADLRGRLGDLEGALADVAAAEAMREALGEGEATSWRARACAYEMQARMVAGDLDGARHARTGCAGAPAKDPQLQLADAELALREGRTAEAAALLPVPDIKVPPSARAPVGLRRPRLVLALLDATDPGQAAGLRRWTLAAVDAIPEPWAGRRRYRACLARPGEALTCREGG